MKNTTLNKQLPLLGLEPSSWEVPLPKKSVSKPVGYETLEINQQFKLRWSPPSSELLSLLARFATAENGAITLASGEVADGFSDR